MPSERLALALERIGPGDWLAFERFAAEFLAPEYPSLRTTASPHGDRGRDGQMYVIDEEPYTMVQYSVTQDWPGKIRTTVRRLQETMPALRVLIYATNQVIGPDADDLVSEIRRSKRVAIDIRDRNWFIERELTYPQRSIASAELASSFVDPLLVERGVRSFAAPALAGDQARVAFVHLALERGDTATDKGWTKSCFEALVLSALHDTSDEVRMTHPEILRRVRNLLPSGHDKQIAEQVSGALRRLSTRGGPVKERRDGSYALAFEEHQKLGDRLAAFALLEEKLKNQLTAAVRIAAPDLDLSDVQWIQVADDMLRGLETVLLHRGEAFASAVTSGQAQQVSAREVLDAVTQAGSETAILLEEEEAAVAIIEVLERPSEELKTHLRRIADAYTMYAFLRQTPDVQRAVLSIFSGGELWLDTNLILPLFAEILLDNPANRYYTTILRAALDAGLRLYMTDGVLDEIESHLHVCLACARTEMAEWRTRVPFLFAAYTLSGRGRREFATWSEIFHGRSRPLDDIRDYLAEVHGIDLRNLTDEVDSASTELRGAVERIWYAVHEQRRTRPDVEIDSPTMDKLVAHDVENCVGVMQLRRKSPSRSPLGYRHWFLTLDRTALSLKDQLSDQLGGPAPDSPALSPDFMAQYLRLAPVRTALERELWVNLPLLTDVSRYEFMPKELVDRADELRREMSNLDERIIRRRVRDELDRLKLELGPKALAGVRGAAEELKGRISSQDAQHA